MNGKIEKSRIRQLGLYVAAGGAYMGIVLFGVLVAYILRAFAAVGNLPKPIDTLAVYAILTVIALSPYPVAQGLAAGLAATGYRRTVAVLLSLFWVANIGLLWLLFH